jgi:glutaminase
MADEATASGTIGAWSSIEGFLAELHTRYAAVDDGDVATYIPELAKADPRWFGIALATTDGHVYEVGDSRQEFTIQSISKPFAYGLALEDRGLRGVLDKVGVEPSGDAFNSISLAPGTGRPLNPMINAGAIATTSLVNGGPTGDAIGRLVSVLSLFAGRPLAINEAVYASENETGHRNRAIGHMLRNFDIVSVDPGPALDAYFRQCSVEVTCRDLAVMAATLANGGVNPTTGERAIRGELVEKVLSVMMSCGMYDFAGEWLYLVGAPAKSGVAGGVLAVWPGQLGLGVFSPRLDARGNSVRGIGVCQTFSRELGLHALRVPPQAMTAVRSVYDLSKVRSKRLRREPERQLLDEIGARAKVYELQGDVSFAAAELAVRQIAGASPSFDRAIIDLRRILRVDPPSAKLIAGLVTGLGAQGKRVVLVGLRRHRELERFLTEALTMGSSSAEPRLVEDLDRALEQAENELIVARAPGFAMPVAVPLAENDLLRGLSAGVLADVRHHLRLQTYRRGDILVRAGDPAGDIYLLTAGEVSVMLELPEGQATRVATVSAGMSFGEIGFISGTVRTADVRADGAVECYVLPRQTFLDLSETNPAVRLIMVENMLRQLAVTATALTAEVAALSR